MAKLDEMIVKVYVTSENKMKLSNLTLVDRYMLFMMLMTIMHGQEQELVSSGYIVWILYMLLPAVIQLVTWMEDKND